ncbi:MAG: NADH-quinone oxidoreductase subunit E [Robiginitomaculum sp.]|nr:MAG: NADH-quinone oxidoreductase subunit E [Robiginitomaculum sp.]
MNHEPKDKILSICADYGNQPDTLIEILHDVQVELGFLSTEALIQIADALNISRADIHGVVSFYDDFRREPTQGPTVKICRAEACQAVGGEDLAKHAKETAHTNIHDVYCLGNCALGPAVLIGDDLYGRVTPERLDALLKTKAAP